jgi:hypothetical protein
MVKTVNERRAETISQTLSGGAGHCLVGQDIVQLEFSGNTKLKVGPCPGQVGHCPVEGL